MTQLLTEFVTDSEFNKALKQAKINNPTASILWKKEL